MMNIFDIFPIREKIAIPSFADALGQHTPYFLVKDVLHGGMGGCVRLEAENGEEYAFKIILPDKFNSEESLNRYLNELKKWRTFSMCDGILRAYDIIKYNDIPCVISTWMQQGDLHSLMISKERTVFYNTLHRIVGSLKWVYDNYHTIHRDLKPANILVDENYLPYIADWGLCKTLGESSTDKDCSKSQIPSESFTADGFVVGTWGFAPSEQMSGSNDIDCRADIFALGVIMYLWETGTMPFQGKSIEETTQNVMSGRFKRLGGLFHRSTFGADKIINKCLATNPSDRYSSYDELLAEIEECAKDVPMFQVYKPTLRSYTDLVNPYSVNHRIRSGEISGAFGNNGAVLTDAKHFYDQISIATNLANIGDYGKALEIISKVAPPIELISKFPDLPLHQDFVINYGWILDKNHQTDKAISWLLKIKDARDLPATYFINLSYFYMNERKMDLCLKTCEQGLKKYPNDIEILGNATLSATSLNLFDDAIKYANKRIHLDNGVQCNYEYAYLCYRWGEFIKETNFPQAIKLYKSSMLYYRKALSFNPKHYASSLDLGIILFKLKRYEDSMKILSSIDQSEASLYWMAKVLQYCGSKDSCISFCNKWLDKNPSLIMLKRAYSESMVDEYVINHLQDGKRFIEDFSWDFFESMINDKDNRIESDLRYYGKLICWSEDIEKSIQFFQWAERVFPEEWTYNFYIASFKLQMGLPKEALEDALIANRKAPWRETGYKLIANCYKAMGDMNSYNEYMAKFVQIETKKKNLYASCKSI